MADAVDSELSRIKKELERGTNLLGTLGNNAPFIGLFGTVLGVIIAFSALGEAGQNSSQMGGVMKGIAEALVATGVGLFVAHSGGRRLQRGAKAHLGHRVGRRVAREAHDGVGEVARCTRARRRVAERDVALGLEPRSRRRTREERPRQRRRVDRGLKGIEPWRPCHPPREGLALPSRAST